MGRIKNTDLYNIKESPTLDDIVIGSDMEKDGKTVNFKISGIVNTINNAIVHISGNEDAEGIDDGYEVIGTGIPTVAKYNELEFEYIPSQNVALLKLSDEFKSTLPTKPSQTMTLALPFKISLPSILPIKFNPLFLSRE